jgi:hypothetical protein
MINKVGVFSVRVDHLLCLPYLSPPWTQKIFPAIKAAMGMVLKQSQNDFQILTLHLLLHSS